VVPQKKPDDFIRFFFFFAVMHASSMPSLQTGLDALDALLEAKNYSSVFVLVDEHTHQYCLSRLQQSCTQLRDVEVLEVESGEANKDIAIAAQLWEAMIQLGADRHSCLINLGGGVITDLGGFVASTLKRGMDFVHIPTTLLAMVDAAIGGKTGVNVGIYKNQAGTFQHPAAIILHPGWLDTLPQREWLSGYAEVIKHALIGAPEQLDRLFAHPPLSRRKDETLILDSARVKERIVAEDPLEKGLRKALNFGHTAGHALEAYSARTAAPLTHGEAVSLGMRIALALSVNHAGLSVDVRDRADAYLAAHYPVLPDCTVDDLWPLMLADKKNRDGQVNFVLLSDVGSPVPDCVIDREAFEKTYAQVKQR
jgi:3-dehydroquinate synthase